jgi:hypothetical protein
VEGVVFDVKIKIKNKNKNKGRKKIKKNIMGEWMWQKLFH